VTTDRDLAARARMTAKFMRRLDELEAAKRLAHLRDASGNFNPKHQAAYFRASWENRRFVDKLVNWRRRRDMREARRRAGWGGPPEYLTPPWEGDAKEANNE
jgi:CelD/BcsL family acetyltransferase involved in cellulose biosynthesis